jgi:hypothetical protein
MVRTEDEISACMGGFPVDFIDQHNLLPDDHNIQEGLTLSDSVSMVNWMACLKQLRWLKKFWNCPVL